MFRQDPGLSPWILLKASSWTNWGTPYPPWGPVPRAFDINRPLDLRVLRLDVDDADELRHRVGYGDAVEDFGLTTLANGRIVYEFRTNTRLWVAVDGQNGNVKAHGYTDTVGGDDSPAVETFRS